MSVTHQVVKTCPMRADRVDDKTLQVVVDRLLRQAELEAVTQELRRLVAERSKAW